MDKKKFVNVALAKNKHYSKVLGTIAGVGHCPFCPENFKYHKKPFLKRAGGWVLTENSWPYKNSAHHFIIIAARHGEHLRDVGARDLAAILSLAKWAVKKYKIKGGALTMRFGDTNYTGATVAHLHAHLISPRVTKRGAKTVNFPIG